MCWGCAGGLCHFFVFSLICRRHIPEEVYDGAEAALRVQVRLSSMPKSPPLLPLLLALLLQADRGPAWSSWIEKDLPMRRVTRFLSWSHQPSLLSV